MLIEWWAEVVQQVRDQNRRLSDLEQEALQSRLANDHEATGVLANYLEQAHREPLDERRRMLSFAAASLANLNLGIGELARAQRILRELDPDDVVALYGVWFIPTRGPAKAHCSRFEKHLSRAPRAEADEIRLAFWEETGAESLASSGCVRVVAAGGGVGMGMHEELVVTGTGLTVLKTLRAYIAARNPDLSSVPGA